MVKEFGFVRVGAIVPKLKIANTKFNSDEIIKQIKIASEKNIDIVATPELAITGYTCKDLFNQDILIESSKKALKNIINETRNLDIISIIGTPIENGNLLFDAAVVIQKGEVLAVIPKSVITNEERRYFCSGEDSILNNINLFGKEVPFGNNIILEDENLSFFIELGEEEWSQTSATIVFNISASSEIVGKYEYRKNLVNVKSSKNICGYVFVSAGVNESTTDLVYSGHSIIYENGELLKENERFDFESNLIYSDIDFMRLKNERRKNNSYVYASNYRATYIKPFRESVGKIEREYKEYPFIPLNEILQEERCKEIINIQTSGLAKRLLHTGIKKTVIGLSGGLDSTLAFLVIIEAYKKLGIENNNMIAITMPGFGTTDRTYENACKLANAYGVTLKEINIKEACLVHFKDIELSEDDRSIAYENAQARERMQILMDVANKEGGLVIGTGDLSELVLGWCTYNGDHMSMYAVNAGVPKTLIRCIVKWIADKEKSETLRDILDTPISPELLPPSKSGEMLQKTESAVGPYVLHDFFLYHFFRYGASPSKIYEITKQTFDGKFKDEEIKKWLKVFLKRFFSQQFKRTCVPDGPKVGVIGISPREDLKMPSDADVSIWINELD